MARSDLMKQDESPFCVAHHSSKICPINEDYQIYWEPQNPLVREKQRGLALLADGVGGLNRGDVASRLAVEEALKIFQGSTPGTDSTALLWKNVPGCLPARRAGLESAY